MGGSLGGIYRSLERQDAADFEWEALQIGGCMTELKVFFGHFCEVPAEGINNELQPIRDLKL